MYKRVQTELKRVDIPLLIRATEEKAVPLVGKVPDFSRAKVLFSWGTDVGETFRMNNLDLNMKEYFGFSADELRKVLATYKYNGSSPYIEIPHTMFSDLLLTATVNDGGTLKRIFEVIIDEPVVEEPAKEETNEVVAEKPKKKVTRKKVKTE